MAELKNGLVVTTLSGTATDSARPAPVVGRLHFWPRATAEEEPTMMNFLWGMIAGGVLIGVVANRRPQWFNRMVTAANAVDDAVNSAVKKGVSRL